MRALLEESFGCDDESFDERESGEACVLALSLTEEGRPLFDSVVLASSAWASGRVRNPGPDDSAWLDGFEKAHDELREHLETRYALLKGDEAGERVNELGFSIGRPLGVSDLVEMLTDVAQSLGITRDLSPDGIRVRTTFTSGKRRYSTDDQDALNSFFLRDLARVAEDCASSHARLGSVLGSYLTENPPEDERVDVRRTPEVWRERLAPGRFPVGRWPSNEHHPLVFSQQLAVNDLWDRLNSHGLHAINGPPGTGKTTLLRDLIAAIVVERARALARLPNPGAAFIGTKSLRSGQFWRRVSLWKPALTGFEIVVASSNNGAVENITREIPGLDAIDPSWLPVDYFADLGSRVIEQDAWGLFAAPLGNKDNRSKFASRFWFGKTGAPAPEIPGMDDERGLQARLKEMRPAPGGWTAATARFEESLVTEQRLREERVRWASEIDRQARVRRVMPAARERVAQAARSLHLAEGALDTARADRADAAETRDAALARRLAHRRDFYPRFFEILFTLGRALRDWRAEDIQLADAVRTADTVLVDADRALTKRTSDRATATVEKRKAQAAYEALLREEAECEVVAKDARRQLGSALPTFDEWVHDDEKRETAAPWADRAWNDARAQVFLAAVELHRAFVASKSEEISANLNAAIDILAGKIPPTVAPEALQAAWATLFFVVPVVSTTFASLDRLFAHLGKESIGWLLIDEAGQAVPQAAAGALWRARRAVVVGDPLQLEPVVTIPFTVQQALRRHFGVSETWLPGTTSAQQLADRVGALGTYIDTADRERVWVGSPLRVHRRCDRQMFEISNRVAYDGLMVFGTGERKVIGLPESAWLHVESAAADGHWIAAEGQVVEALLAELIEQKGLHPSDLFLISPFRAVVRQLDRIARKHRGIRSGTIHRVQGKESDVVIVVLGGDPRRPGAKQWAAQKPNLINVAASRAKRRLYVVGDRDSWMRYPYFDVMAQVLPLRAPHAGAPPAPESRATRAP